MLNADGFLESGVHDLSVTELRATFGSFNGSDRRCRLFDQLAKYIERLTTRPWFRELLIDGSFVTSKQAPSDIDLIVVVDTTVLPQETLAPADYNLLSRSRARHTYGFDVIMAASGSAALENWVTYFSRVKGSEKRKGLVRLAP